MKESLRELCKNLVCIWDEGCKDIVWVNYDMPKSGIYMIRIGEDFYIGRSVDLHYRIQNHLNGIFKRGYLGSDKVRKRFEELRQLSIYIICESPENKLDELERYYIEKHKPVLNKQLVNKNEDFELITTKISSKNKRRINMCKVRGYGGTEFSSHGEVISSILDYFFEENGEPEGM